MKLSTLGQDAFVANVTVISCKEIGRCEPPRWDRCMAHSWSDWLLSAGRVAKTVRKAFGLLPRKTRQEVADLSSVAALWVFPVERFTAPGFTIPRSDTYLVGFPFLSRMVAKPAALHSMMALPDRIDPLIVMAGVAGGKACLSGWTGHDRVRWTKHDGLLWQRVRVRAAEKAEHRRWGRNKPTGRDHSIPKINALATQGDRGQDAIGAILRGRPSKPWLAGGKDQLATIGSEGTGRDRGSQPGRLRKASADLRKWSGKETDQ